MKRPLFPGFFNLENLMFCSHKGIKREKEGTLFCLECGIQLVLTPLIRSEEELSELIELIQPPYGMSEEEA